MVPAFTCKGPDVMVGLERFIQVPLSHLCFGVMLDNICGSEPFH